MGEYQAIVNELFAMYFFKRMGLLKKEPFSKI